jgi:hypothetical protein
MTENSPIKLRLPTQDLDHFDSFALEPGAALAWAENLPLTNVRAVAQQLIQVVSDLNRVAMTPPTRHRVMEALRPTLDTALSNSGKRFLNQPLVLPEEPRQLADIADRLLGFMTTAYTLTAAQTLSLREDLEHDNPAQLVCESLHRAITYAGRKILLALQLYQPIELNSWRTLHQLYSIAEQQNLNELPVDIGDGQSSTIRAAYLQPLLLACCKPNQLRQADMAGVYRGLRDWNELVLINSGPTGSGLFRVDLDADRPPMYTTILGERGDQQTRFIDTDRLVAHLEQRKQMDRATRQKGISFDRETTIPANIVDHLIATLGTASQRNFSRTPASGTLRISVGLSNTHFHVAGERTLEQLLYGDEYIATGAQRVSSNPFLAGEGKKDRWEEANPEDDYVEEVTDAAYGEVEKQHEVDVDPHTRSVLEDQDTEPPPSQRYPIHQARIINISPGGYCVTWPAGLPDGLRTGDIAAVRDADQKHWLVAVVRWVSQIADGDPLTGLELLSPRATPYGARITHVRGESSDPMRVLLLPEIKLVGKPHTLITPRTGFQEQQKIVLLRQGEEFLVQLTRQLAATATFLQFDFRYIRQMEQGRPVVLQDRQSTERRFDSMWDDL